MIFDFLRGAPKKSADTDKPSNKQTLLTRITQGLARTRAKISRTFSEIFLRQAIDDTFLDKLYEGLIAADCGPSTAEHILERVKDAYFSAAEKPEDLKSLVADVLLAILAESQKPAYVPSASHEIILVVGVNGVGKTTTIGRLAHHLKSQGISVALAAGDTFRAAAIEQLQTWGQRNDVPIIAQHTGADSASVIYDAYQAALAQNTQVTLADTAGRLHNKDHLMAELAKINRVLKKIHPDAPQQTWLVLDATVGQNGLKQAEAFHKHMQLTGIILTKLDGTAKGGIVFAIADQLKLPIYYLGVGEGIADLMPFDAPTFVAGLLEDS